MQTQHTYSFYCDNLNIRKYDLLLSKAVDICDFRNEISVQVCSNPTYFFQMNKFDWMSHFKIKIDSCNNQDISHAIGDVYVAYENKRNKFSRSIVAKIQDEVKITRYKKNGKNFKKDDIKEVNVVMKSTPMTTAVSYIARYYNEGFVDFLRNNKSEKPSVQTLRDNAIGFIDGRLGKRILKLAIAKQERAIKKVTEHQIEFESLSFTSCTEQKQNIIQKNKIKGSKFNAYITLPGQNTESGKIHIPTKFSDKHHGGISNYFKEPNKKGQRNTTYTIIFDRKRIRVCLTRLKESVVVKDKTNYYGIDVNVKHNLFCDKHENTIDYDRNLFNDYVKFLRRCDEKKQSKSKDDNKISNRDQKIKDKYISKMRDMLKRQSSELVKTAKLHGRDHIVMEDLQSMGRSYSKSDEMEGFKYSRLIKLLNLTDLKNIVSSIGNKHGVQTTFIQPHYTSKGCKCGCIDDRNRQIQEIFKCIQCFHEENADAHAASMIEDRLVLDVLRQSLLVKENGVYSPKKLNKNSIKNILVECYDNNSAQKTEIDDEILIAFV